LMLAMPSLSTSSSNARPRYRSTAVGDGNDASTNSTLPKITTINGGISSSSSNNINVNKRSNAKSNRLILSPKHRLMNASSKINGRLIFLACIWIMIAFITFFMTASSSSSDKDLETPLSPSLIIDSSEIGKPNTVKQSLRHNIEKLEKLMHMGKTQSLPSSIAFIVVVHSQDFLVEDKLIIDPMDAVLTTIKSIFAHTDRNSILSIFISFDPTLQQRLDSPNKSWQIWKEEIKGKLHELDDGTTKHWHGGYQHVHSVDGNEGEENVGQLHAELEHDSKIIVNFPTISMGVGAMRRHAGKHLRSLFKIRHPKNHKMDSLDTSQMDNDNASKDVIALFLHPGAILVNRNYLPMLSGSLLSRRFANAVVLPIVDENIGTTRSLAQDLTRSITHASADDMSSSNGKSYPTPILDGGSIAMTLGTFWNLPATDDSLQSRFAADLELAWNMWLCADGIDIVHTQTYDGGASLKYSNLDILNHVTKHEDEFLSLQDASRLIKAWIKNENILHELIPHISRRYNLSTNDLINKLDDKNTLDGLPSSLDVKCRSFQHFLSKVNLAIQPSKYILPLIDTKINQLIPSKPLRKLNLEIIQRTHPIDLKYVDITNGHKEDPHRGAKDEYGEFGYIHDETSLRMNPPKFQVPSKDAACKKTNHYKMLTDKVFVNLEAHEKAEAIEQKRVKLFCVVYTIAKSHDKIPQIRETWGNKCDGFMVASDKTDKELGTVQIVHEGPEEYNNIWQKVRSIWSYIYDNYYEKYDFFHIGGDDLYVLVENLRLYLESEEIQLAANGGEKLPTGKETEAWPVFLGRRFAEQGDMDRIFNSGGSGYTINKAALKALVVDAFPICMPHLHTFAEDVMVAQCLRKKISVYPFDTKDEAGGERYMPFQPGHHLTYRAPANKRDDWYAKYSIDIKYGLDHCAAESVAFHYIKPPLMRNMHAILYGYCSK